MIFSGFSAAHLFSVDFHKEFEVFIIQIVRTKL